MKRIVVVAVLLAAFEPGFHSFAGEPSASKPHVFSMTCKVTSCNGALSTPEGRAKALDWFRRNHISKLWLESYRHGEHVATERLVEERDAFRREGFEVCGCITPTSLNAPTEASKKHKFSITCWSDPTARQNMRAIVARTAKIFDTVILDDFLFSGCGDSCARCKADKGARKIEDWGAYRRALLYEVCERDILPIAREANPKAHFIIKYPCWYQGYRNRGYEPVRQTALFGECWVGTETRDANPNPLQACWIIDWMNHVTGGHCGGGWYDALDSSPEKFVEQAYYTILGGAKESLVHCYDYLVADDPGVMYESSARSHACAAAFEKEIDNLQKLADFLQGAERGPYWMTPQGVSVHIFRKNGKVWRARVNTTAKTVLQMPPYGRELREITDSDTAWPK